MRHRVPGIDGHVQHRELELGRVQQHGLRVGRDFDGELDARAENGLQQAAQLGQALLQPHLLRHQGLAPREREQLARELRRAVDCTGNGFDLWPHRFGALAAQDEEVVADDHQRVVEVVRDAAREPAERLHLLGLQQRLLDAMPGLRLLAQFVRGAQHVLGPRDRQPAGEEQGDERRNAERQDPQHLVEPAAPDLAHLHSRADVHGVVPYPGEGQEPLLLVQRGDATHRALRPARQDLAEDGARGRHARRRVGEVGPVREDHAVLAEHRDRRARLLRRQRRVETLEVFRQQVHRDHALERTVRTVAAPAGADERRLLRALQHWFRNPEQVPAGLVGEEVRPVGHLHVGRRMRTIGCDGVAQSVVDPDGVDRSAVAGQRAQALVQLLAVFVRIQRRELPQGVLHPRQQQLVGVQHLERMLLGDALDPLQPQRGLVLHLHVADGAHGAVDAQRNQDAQDGEPAQRAQVFSLGHAGRLIGRGA